MALPARGMTMNRENVIGFAILFGCELIVAASGLLMLKAF